MQIIDRYITYLFGKIFVICFVSFAGLYIVIDTFSNLEELLQLGQRSGSLSNTMTEYYGPRLLQLFDRTAPLITLVSAIFSLTLMQRSNELTAIQAGGISGKRIARPILIMTLLVIVASIVNREAWIPKVRESLTVNAQDKAGSREHSIGLVIDHTTGIQIRGKKVRPTEQQIVSPVFTLPDSLRAIGSRITAELGEFIKEDKSRPSGYVLRNFLIEQSDGDQPNMSSAPDQKIVFSHTNAPWLEEDELFVATTVDTQQLAFPDELARNSSLPEMINIARRPSTSFSNRGRVDIHGRIVQPIFDFSILLIGLPLVIARGERNIFLSVGACLSVVVLMMLVLIGCHAMGAARILHPPALAAWLPIMLFVPVAAVTYQMLDR